MARRGSARRTVSLRGAPDARRLDSSAGMTVCRTRVEVSWRTILRACVPLPKKIHAALFSTTRREERELGYRSRNRIEVQSPSESVLEELHERHACIAPETDPGVKSFPLAFLFAYRVMAASIPSTVCVGRSRIPGKHGSGFTGPFRSMAFKMGRVGEGENGRSSKERGGGRIG